jgi:hypothetical protein
MADLETRLRRLEVGVSRLRITVLLAFATAAGALAWGMFERRDPVVEGRLWIARDSSGTVRGMFGLSNDGVGLTMYDSTGQMRLDVGIAPGGTPGILLLSKRGEPVASLNLTDGRVPILRMSNVADSVRLEVSPRGNRPPIVVQGRERPDTSIARGPRR